MNELTRRGIGAIESCLASPAKAPPSGPAPVHEIKHAGFRLFARRDTAGMRLITREGDDFTYRFALIANGDAFAQSAEPTDNKRVTTIMLGEDY